MGLKIVDDSDWRLPHTRDHKLALNLKSANPDRHSDADRKSSTRNGTSNRTRNSNSKSTSNSHPKP